MQPPQPGVLILLFLSKTKINKIVVNGPVVELDGDEMTRVIWKKIKQDLVLLYLDFAWTRGLLHRAKIDGNEALKAWCLDLEDACIEVIDQDEIMTKDLAFARHGKDMKREHWVITNVYMDAVIAKLKEKLATR